jgi:hypothetical protein
MTQIGTDMADAINSLIWILEKLHLTPSPVALWVLFLVVLVSILLAPLTYIAKRWRSARAQEKTIVPAVGMALSAIAFLCFLLWDLKASGGIDHEKISTSTEPVNIPAGKGGSGGHSRVEYGQGDAIAGKGGRGGVRGGGDGGAGGSAAVIGGRGNAIAGDGGDAGQAPGEGGQGGASPWNKMVASDPILQRVDLVQRLQEEYKSRVASAVSDPHDSEVWVNSRLQERGYNWRIKETPSGFQIINAPVEK